MPPNENDNASFLGDRGNIRDLQFEDLSYTEDLKIMEHHFEF